MTWYSGVRPPTRSTRATPRDAQDARLEFVARRFPEFRARALRTCEADADNRKRGEREPPDGRARRRRERGTDLTEPAVDVELGLDHVDLPVEEDTDLGRSAAGGGANGDGAGNILHRFLDGTCNGGHHLVRWHHAIIHQNDDAREIGLRENRRRHAQGAQYAGDAGGDGDESDREPVPDGERAGAGRS